MPDPKQLLRENSAAAIAALSLAARQEKSAAILARLMQTTEYQNARVIAAYDSDQFEAGTHELHTAVLSAGKTLGLPRTSPKERGLKIHRITDLLGDLEMSRFGFREPRKATPVIAVDQIDLVIVPGVAFDLKGNRLGRGVGYYDRFLSLSSLRAIVCALAFDCQIAARVPVEAHDRPVRMIVTESKIIRAYFPTQ